MEMIRLVTEEARSRDIAVTICIRDRHDNLVAHIRMKGALLGSVDLACQKARSSALFPAPSSFLENFPALQFSNGIIRLTYICSVATATLQIALSVHVSVHHQNPRVITSLNFLHQLAFYVNQLSSSINLLHQPTFFIKQLSMTINLIHP